jgi:hypothetical protein
VLFYCPAVFGNVKIIFPCLSHNEKVSSFYLVNGVYYNMPEPHGPVTKKLVFWNPSLEKRGAGRFSQKIFLPKNPP